MKCLKLDEQTIAAALDVIISRFGKDACSVATKPLFNPLRCVGDDIGVLVCDDTGAVAVSECIVRRLYWKQAPFLGINGGMLCVRKEASPLVLLPLLKQAHVPRFASKIFYSNTCAANTVKLKACVGVKNQGPASWNSIRYVERSKLCHVVARACRKLLRYKCVCSVVMQGQTHIRRSCCVFKESGYSISRLFDLDRDRLDRFWKKYLSENRGIVGSRSVDELEWLWGDAIRKGSRMMLVAEKEGEILGYIVIKESPYVKRRWQVVDMIASGNDLVIMGVLLRAVKHYMLRKIDVDRVEITGFPMWVQQQIGSVFRKSYSVGYCPFVWSFSDLNLERECGNLLSGKEGWFFGPFDGDFCFN